MSTSPIRILLVEDNRDLAAGLASNLSLEGYEVRHCSDGAEVLSRAREWQPGLIVLDMMLPNRDGFEVLSDLRSHGLTMPVLCLTARGEELDKVRALRSGADDYVTKPFGLMELLARVEAVLRRSGDEPNEITRIGEVAIDLVARQVRRAGELIELSPKEFDLLAALAARPGRVMSRHELLKLVWGHRGEVVSRTVDTHIAELRRKLEADPHNPSLIVTVRKAGYRLG